MGQFKGVPAVYYGSDGVKGVGKPVFGQKIVPFRMVKKGVSVYVGGESRQEMKKSGALLGGGGSSGIRGVVGGPMSVSSSFLIGRGPSAWDVMNAKVAAKPSPKVREGESRGAVKSEVKAKGVAGVADAVAEVKLDAAKDERAVVMPELPFVGAEPPIPQVEVKMEELPKFTGFSKPEWGMGEVERDVSMGDGVGKRKRKRRRKNRG